MREKNMHVHSHPHFTTLKTFLTLLVWSQPCVTRIACITPTQEKPPLCCGGWLKLPKWYLVVNPGRFFFSYDGKRGNVDKQIHSTIKTKTMQFGCHEPQICEICTTYLARFFEAIVQYLRTTKSISQLLVLYLYLCFHNTFRKMAPGISIKIFCRNKQ